MLKGGYLLEVRIDSHARATKDLDLAMRSVGEKAEVAALLREALSVDPDSDHIHRLPTAVASVAGNGPAAKKVLNHERLAASNPFVYEDRKLNEGLQLSVARYGVSPRKSRR